MAKHDQYSDTLTQIWGGRLAMVAEKYSTGLVVQSVTTIITVITTIMLGSSFTRKTTQNCTIHDCSRLSSYSSQIKRWHICSRLTVVHTDCNVHSCVVDNNQQIINVHTTARMYRWNVVIFKKLPSFNDYKCRQQQQQFNEQTEHVQSSRQRLLTSSQHCENC